MLKLSPHLQATPAQVTERINQGEAIAMTPHIGNKWRSDMGIAKLGVLHATFEGNLTTRDDLDVPEAIIVNGAKHVITRQIQEVMSPYLQLDGSSLPTEHQHLLAYGSKPANIHHHSTAEVLGKDNVMVSSEYIFFQSKLALPALHILLRQGYPIFHRQVNELGHMGPRDHANDQSRAAAVVDEFAQLKHQHVQAVLGNHTVQSGGPVLANNVNVLLLLLRSLESQMNNGMLQRSAAEAEGWTVSGATMLGYAKKPDFVAKLDEMYTVLRREMPHLPESSTLQIVPGAALEFLPHAGETSHLKLVDAVAEHLQHEAQLGRDIGAAAPADRPGMIAVRNEIKGRLTEARRELQHSNTNQGSHTQYDVLRTGHQIIVPESIQHLTFAQIDRNLNVGK